MYFSKYNIPSVKTVQESEEAFAVWYLIPNTLAVPQKGLFSRHSTVQSTDAQ